MTQVVASLVERDVEGIADSARIAFRQGADFIECRLDHLGALSKAAVAEVRRAALGPAMSSLRSTSEGGRSGLKGDRRNAILEAQLGRISSSSTSSSELTASFCPHWIATDGIRP